MKRAMQEAVLALLTVVIMGVTVSLGQWQLRRADQKESLARAIETRARLPELTDRDLPLKLDQTDRRGRLRGFYVPSVTIYLDNRQMNGRPGFFVLTPLRLSAAPSTVIMVQRGWIPRDPQDRLRLPSIQTPSGEVEVVGRLVAPPSRLFEFADARDGPIRQNVDLVEFAREFNLPLMTQLTILQTEDDIVTRDDRSGSLLAHDPLASKGHRSLASPTSTPILRDWARIDHGVHKHYGYAAQWFGLAGLAAILYLWFRLLRPLIRSRRSVPPTQPHHDRPSTSDGSRANGA